MSEIQNGGENQDPTVNNSRMDKKLIYWESRIEVSKAVGDTCERKDRDMRIPYRIIRRLLYLARVAVNVL